MNHVRVREDHLLPTLMNLVFLFFLEMGGNNVGQDP